MLNKKCPKCEKRFGELDNYCTKCGIALEKDVNRCSENKGAMCRAIIFDDDDNFCSCCGSLTTYAIERQKKE